MLDQNQQEEDCEDIEDESQRKKLYARLYVALKVMQRKYQQEEAKYHWDRHARAKQRVPNGSWRTWLILAGRGFGKTRTGSETLRQWVHTGPVNYEKF